MTPAAVERRALQLAVLTAGIVPVGGGLYGVLNGAQMLGEATATASLDSHVRYLSGLLLGIGLTFWASIRNIERRTTVFRCLGVIVFVGGAARLAGAVGAGLAPERWPMPAALVMELVVTPGLVLWQGRIARQAAKIPSIKTTN